MSSRSTLQLPADHHLHRSINIQQDHRVRIQTSSAVIALLAVAVVPLFDLPIRSGWPPGTLIAVIVLGVLLYFLVHEATHGVVAQLLTGRRSSYSFRFPFLRTGNTGILHRGALATVALAPVVFWGALFLIALFTVPMDFRMLCYVLLVLNIAGSTGDFVEAAIALRQPEGALLRDTGAELEIFLPTGQQ